MSALIRPRAIQSLEKCERALDAALRQLRALDGGPNTSARSALERRIGALRRRRTVLQINESIPARRAP